MAHGHGHGHIDLDAMRGEMPPPFCHSRWKEMVAALGITAAVVVFISIQEGNDKAPIAATMPVQSGDVGMSPLVGGPTTATTALPNPNGTNATTPVAFAGAIPPFGVPSGADSNVRLVGSTQRSAFNVAATNVRPSVIGIRATFPQPGVQRIGSGIVVHPNGYAVTCNHVIAGANRIVATRFRNPDRELPVQLVGVSGDLAVVRVIDDTIFPAATLVNSDSIQVGDWVLAVGHPFGLGTTVTAGIVGQRRASLTFPGGSQYTGLLQTDAPINEGSSGGPLVDTAGRVVGINMAIYAPTGVFNGNGFAIPSNRVFSLLSSVIPGFASGAGFASNLAAMNAMPTAPTPPAPGLGSGASGSAGGTWFGLGLGNLTPALSSRLGYPQMRGVVVDSVVMSSPAELAQLRQGDVVLAVGGQPVQDVSTAQQILSSMLVGQPLSIEVWRQGRREMTTIRGIARPAG